MSSHQCPARPIMRKRIEVYRAGVVIWFSKEIGRSQPTRSILAVWQVVGGNAWIRAE